MRYILSVTHRWAGLAIAAFLFVSGLTGAVDLLGSRARRSAQPAPDERGSRRARAPIRWSLPREIEARDPRIVVTYVPLVPRRASRSRSGVEPRVDPATGQLLRARLQRGLHRSGDRRRARPARMGRGLADHRARTSSRSSTCCTTRLHIPRDVGHRPLGHVVDGRASRSSGRSTASSASTSRCRSPRAHAPARRQSSNSNWRAASGRAGSRPGGSRRRGSAYRINFDIHRAFGLWLWVLLFILAFTGVSLNLYSEVAQPLVTLFSSFTPSPFDMRTPSAARQADRPAGQPSPRSWRTRARRRRTRRGWTEPVGVGLLLARATASTA